MPHYYRLGQIPPKRHTQFRRADGHLYAEELVSTEGFSCDYSLVYHVYPPTLVERMEPPIPCAPRVAVQNNMQHRAFLGFNVRPEADYIASRKILLTNSDCQLLVAQPTQLRMNYFFKNASADELIFIHVGSGRLKTGYGEIPFAYGDYLHIPRGCVYQLEFDTPENKLLITESFSPITFPNRYLSRYGQLMEHSPFCERDLRKPENLETHDEKGEFTIVIKKNHQFFPYVYKTHPFDFVGWDGCYYPYAFSIHNFEPITGRVHLPPPIHQTFQSAGFVVCSFVPRLYDYHPLAIPAPYQHSNLDSDEVLYYVAGEFMSRKHVEPGMFTLHPMGIPHGPHPGAIEKSIGQKETVELAVMVDTFRPLFLTEEALGIEIKDYYHSWVE
jgi:homogentisate 1,2-dioxygenase